jgi:nitronate monooxygenase
MSLSLSQRLNLAVPLIQAPMAGGPTSPALVAAVSEAGALGSFGSGYLQPEALLAQVQALRELTRRPFAINLFLPTELAVSLEELRAAQSALRPWRDRLGLAEPPLPTRFAPDFSQQFEAVLEARPALFSWTFGRLDRARLDTLKARGILTVGTATTREEAVQLERDGVDAIVVQGVEAGGHRGCFDPEEPDQRGLLALLGNVREAVSTPLIAAGGLMHGREIAAVQALGAELAQLGTAFLACPESGIHATYRRALEERRQQRTALTRAFSGRPARGLVNAFMEELRDAARVPYPAQNTLTGDIRRAGAEAGNAECLSLWAGEGLPRLRVMPAGQLVATLAEEWQQALQHDGGGKH